MINESFEHIIPLTFRCLYACREFDFVGVFKNASDNEAILEKIRQHVKEQNIHAPKINSCFGEVGYATDETDFKEIVHKMCGKAVYGAIKY